MKINEWRTFFQNSEIKDFFSKTETRMKKNREERWKIFHLGLKFLESWKLIKQKNIKNELEIVLNVVYILN